MYIYIYTEGAAIEEIEKLSIPLEAHHKAQSNEVLRSFQAKKLKELQFFIFWPILLKLHI